MLVDYVFLSGTPKEGSFGIIAKNQLDALESYNVLNKKVIKNGYFPTIEIVMYGLYKLKLVKDRFYYTDRLYSIIAEKLLKDSKADILHCWSFHGYNILKNNNYKVTIIERASASINFSYNYLFKEYLKFGLNFPISKKHIELVNKELSLADYVLTCSNFAKETYIKEGFDENKIKVLYYGCDINKFKKKSQYCENDIINFIFVGYDWIRKGLYYLIKAWKNLNKELPSFNKKSRLLIFGPNKNDAILSKLINNENNIKLMGRKKPTEIYKKGDIFIFPSLEDGFGLVVLEAMSSGLPIITSENTGASELMHKNGFIIPPKDVKAIKNSIIYFFENICEIKNMGRTSRKIAERYTWDNYKKEYIKLLYGLI